MTHTTTARVVIRPLANCNRVWVQFYRGAFMHEDTYDWSELFAELRATDSSVEIVLA